MKPVYKSIFFTVLNYCTDMYTVCDAYLHCCKIVR